MEHFDIIIIGAGLSGIDAACHFKMHCPDKEFCIFEARGKFGGTWDLFTYPGIRSDSDMHTFSYSFRPWTYDKSISDAATIMDYLQGTMEEYDIEKHIRYHSPIHTVAWSSSAKRWIVSGTNATGKIEFSCDFLMMCTGYYDYEEGYTPNFVGLEDYQGRFVHPQKWTQDIDYEDKEVIVIGSGATAVTLIPAMADKTRHITMLQRSPTYVLSQPLHDPFAKIIHKLFPSRVAHHLARWKNILRDIFLYNQTRKRPESVKKFIRKRIVKQLGKDYPVDVHFNPTYNPWDERLCSVPDNDLFLAIKSGACTVVTDHIDSFVEQGIRLKSGETLEADLVISATGLNLKLVGGIQVYADEKAVDLSSKLNYKGAMLQDVPNMAFIAGYTNAAWTLKADLVCAYVCKLLSFMDEHQYQVCVPKLQDEKMESLPIIDFTSGYIQRSLDKLPKQGTRHPWRLNQNYIKDKKILTRDKIDDGVLQFGG